MLRKRLQGNLIANSFILAINTAIQLGSVPIFLAYWSKEIYGEWLLLYSIPGYLALADVGLSSVAANDAAMYNASGNRSNAERSLHTATGFLLVMSSLGVLIMSILAWALPWRQVLALDLTGQETVSWTIVLLSIYSMCGLAFTLFSAVYRCALRTARGVYIAGSSRLFELIAIAGCLEGRCGFVVISFALLAVRVVFVVGMYFDSRNISPGLGIGLREFSLKELSRTWKPALAFTGFPIGNALYFQGFTIVIGHTLGPTGVVVFNSVRAFTRATVQTLNIVKQAILPEFSHLLGRQDIARSRRLFDLAMEVSAVIVLVQAVALYLAGPWIVMVWTHAAVSTSRSILCIYLAGASLNGLWMVSSGLLFGVNRHSGLTALYVTCAAGAVASVAYFKVLHGISGAGIVMLLCEIVILPYALGKCAALTRQTLKEFLSNLVHLRELRAATLR